MPMHWQAWQIIARRHRFYFTEDRFYSLGGIPSRDILKVLSVEQGLPIDPLAVAREKEAEYLPLIAQVEPINTVVGVARENYGKIPLAVASGDVVPPGYWSALSATMATWPTLPDEPPDLSEAEPLI